MADKFSKQEILNILKEKVSAKGFAINVDKNELSAGASTILDMLEVIAESLSEIFYADETLTGTIRAKSLKFGPMGLQLPMSYKGAEVEYSAVTDPKFFIWLEALHTLLKAAYPEPGYGAPDVFATAMKSLLALKPKSITGKIKDGSNSVKITK